MDTTMQNNKKILNPLAHLQIGLKWDEVQG